jgi:glucose/arabinose dehydrogenase
MSSKLFIAFILIVTSIRSTQTLARTNAPPTNFDDQYIHNVGETTTDLTLTPDGRLLVTTQAGRILVYQNNAFVSTPALDLDAQGLVCTDDERGLESLEIDPGFATNHYIYVYYTHRNGHNSATCPLAEDSVARNRVVRYTLNNNNTATNPQVILDNIPNPCGSHNGGDLHFGPLDGLLYISTGDGGFQCGVGSRRARYRSNLAGKILRITKEGNIPSDNPNANAPNSVLCGQIVSQPLNATLCKEIYAWGLRNPFRFTFKPDSQTFYINDVGHDTWEEIDLGAKDADYGWPCYEGNNHVYQLIAECPPTSVISDTKPIYEYNHNTNRSGVTGSAYVAFGDWPAPYDDAYYFGDYTNGNIYRLTQTSNVYSDTLFSERSGGVVTMVFDPVESALYYAMYYGEIRKIYYVADGNFPPIASATATPTNGGLPLNVTFDGTASSDPENSPITYEWDFGDGSPIGTTSTLTHQYTVTGEYEATLIVRDSAGKASRKWTQRISVGNTPPNPIITAPSTSSMFSVGQVITLTGVATDTQDGTIAPSGLSWNVKLVHVSAANTQNAHTHPFALGSGTELTITMPSPEGLDAAPYSHLEVTFKAIDSAGLEKTVTQTIEPARTMLTFSTQPSGLSLVLNNIAVTTTYMVNSWQGYNIPVSAPSTQQATNGQWYQFTQWNDNTTASAFNLTTPISATTYTAIYQLFTPTNTPVVPTPIASATPMPSIKIYLPVVRKQ